MIDFIENVCQAGCQKALYCKTYARFQVTLWATEIKKISLVSRSWSTVWINMQKMSNGDYFDEKMRRGDRSKEARRISPPLKLLLKSPKLRGSTAPKSAHLHRGREQGAALACLCFTSSFSKRYIYCWLVWASFLLLCLLLKSICLMQALALAHHFLQNCSIEALCFSCRFEIVLQKLDWIQVLSNIQSFILSSFVCFKK